MYLSLLTSVLTSLGVSALATIVFQTYITRRIQLHFDQQFEQFKASLGVRAHIRQELHERRIDAYSKLAELCYRTRNLARDIVRTSGSTESLLEFVGRARELEEMLYHFIEDLRAHQLFEFYRTAAEPLPLGDHTDSLSAKERLVILYAKIEDSYPEVMERLTKETEALA
jgi:septal ring factor EnvC (AmiA/AmiB activator)